MEHAAFSKIRRSHNLTSELADLLRQQIKQGKYAIGSKLPSSKYIEEQAGVSRSVVREAVAQLKAEGILISRQGVGVFVANAKSANTNAFEINASEFASIKDAIQILELRKAVETEMCALSAEKRTESQLAKIKACFVQISQKNEQKLDSMHEDFAFHKSIAEATSNPYFVRFIDFIGAGVIPARDIITQGHDLNTTEYLDLIQKEHEQIMRAIELKDKEFARAAMRAHLENSIARHQQRIEVGNLESAS
ncbi:FadR family transcriptional regulator [Catenovulum sp. 2E275]|uniref:FadR/GntR family transcriptional regulator n=1 Tax=Catenovulum sp. 2E275 TaxID=2980497 RepID=UPI0021CF67E6|nr:FadR/GntR family transcriptional regulator [Catenovulum sp. 2E275]MCU4676778.1 FadR family transcriptional regulator [Catenovulum sp. 2E275]